MSYSIKSDDGRVFKVEHKDGRKGVFHLNSTGLFQTDYRPLEVYSRIDNVAEVCLGPAPATKVCREQLWWLLGRGADEIRYIRKHGTTDECKIRNLTFKENMVHYEKVGEVNPHRSLYITSIVGVKTPEGWFVV